MTYFPYDLLLVSHEIVNIQDAQFAGPYHQSGGIHAIAVVAVRKQLLHQLVLSLLQTLHAERHSSQTGNLLLGVAQGRKRSSYSSIS